jgi:hypothetical protein
MLALWKFGDCGYSLEAGSQAEKELQVSDEKAMGIISLLMSPIAVTVSIIIAKPAITRPDSGHRGTARPSVRRRGNVVCRRLPNHNHVRRVRRS